MRDAVIVEAVRTPVGIGKPGKGALSGMHPVDVSAAILCTRYVHRAGIESHLVEDVYWGCVGQVGEQSTNIGRNAALAAGFPQSVAGTTVDTAVRFQPTGRCFRCRVGDQRQLGHSYRWRG